jgi:hypothetical protein|tara:strand:- start:247 stop:693 length:447 start_codon:yes stop_codon:yes gene_type:complete
MSRITKQMLYDFRADFNRLLELKNSTDFRALQTLDLFDIKLANASFSQSNATFKLELTLKGGDTKEMEDLKSYHEMGHFNWLDLNNLTSIIDGQKVQIVGYRPRSSKRPFLISYVDNPKKQGMYVIDEETCKNFFSKEEKLPTLKVVK